ncbi:MAG TPA: response regulator transcription factor [Actinomycetota bacterium]
MRILVVDDHLVVREGLRWMLGPDSGIEIAAEAETGAKALEAIEADRPDVVLLDIHLPDGSGLDLLATIRSRFPGLPVVMLTMSDEPTYVEEAVRAGAAGYLLKSAPRGELIRAIEAAAGGDAYIQAEVTRPLLQRFSTAVRSSGVTVPLSPRELEVVALLAEGLADKQIAAQLGVSETTVKSYLRQAYEKLGAADRAQAVAIALRSRLID